MATSTLTLMAAGLEAEELNATKTRPPVSRSPLVARRRLLTRLDEASSTEFTLICTPPGFGKTALLAEWVHHIPDPVAWVSLDSNDGDPIRFWRYIAAALEPTCVSISAQLAPLLVGPETLPVQHLVAKLVNALVNQPERIVLVLDDYHCIHTQAIHDALTLLLDRLPSQLRLIVASRSDPALPLARLRARGQLAELRAADFRFTFDEARTLLEQATSRVLDAETVASLETRTEGWAVGLQLAGLSLQHHDDPRAFVASFAGTHRFVLDFLTEEVLARQPPERVRFLLETSVLEHVSGPLCDAVTGATNSQTLLEGLERDNVFLIALDDSRRWWRYHQLFADVLRARLYQADAERVPVLQRNAATWFEEHGMIDPAIQHALHAHEVERAARLVEVHAQAYLIRNETATVQRWIGLLPDDLVHARARLGLIAAALARIRGRIEDVEPLLAHVEDAYRRSTPEPDMPNTGISNVPAMLALQRAALAYRRRDAQALQVLSRDALAATRPDDRYLRYVVDWYRAMAVFLEGRMLDAEEMLPAIETERWAAGDFYAAMYAAYARSQAQRALGRLNAARGTCEEAIEAFSRVQPGTAFPTLGIAQVGLAEVLLEQGELDAALELAVSGSDLCEQLGYARWRAAGLTTIARVRQAGGDLAGALAAFEKAGPSLTDAEAVTDLMNPIVTERARTDLARGETRAVERWVVSRGLHECAEPTFAREQEQLILVRLLLAQGAPVRAFSLVRRLRALAEEQARSGSVLQMQVLEAVALDADGDKSAAHSVLSDALIAGEPEGALHPFLDGGVPVKSLIETLAAHRVSRTYLDRVLAAFQPISDRWTASTGQPLAVSQEMVEPLSDRELEVLRLLASGMSNREIADELVVALDTVKKHVSHIFGKLGASSRTQAVARAHELALL